MQTNQSSRQRSRIRTLANKTVTALLVMVACVSVLIALASLYSPIFEFIVTIFPPLRLFNLTALLLFIFSSVGLTIGLERYETLTEAKEEARKKHEEVVQVLNQIKKTVEQNDQNLVKEVAGIQQTLMATAVTVKPLIGNDVVYEESIRLIKACKGSEIIRATSFIHYPIHYANLEDISEPNREYLETLAKAIGQGKQKKLGMVYKVVMGFGLNERGEPPPEGQRPIRKRRELFRQNNALDRMEIRCLDGSWSLNLLIVGHEQMMIGFPTIVKDADMRTGILINHKEFVGSVIRWYDEFLWSEAKVVNWTGEETQQ